MTYTIRHATIGDAAVIAHHRVAMFRDMGEVPTEALAAELLSASTTALAALLSEGSYVGWLASDTSDRVIAGAGADVKPQLPRISHDGTRVVTGPLPLIVNVYTEPAWRGKGIARGDRVVLHASAAGRPLYQSLGFTPTNEMRWTPSLKTPDHHHSQWPVVDPPAAANSESSR
jgi:GNAT superfamily N-acetyltransferase